MSIVEISNIQLLVCFIFVLFIGISSIFLNLGLEKDISIGAIRTFIQLFIMGYILRYIFKIDNAYFIPTFMSMVISYMIVTVVVTAVIVQVDPWYKPQYFILLGGMVVGKSMNAVAISLDRLFSEVRKRREEIELYLSWCHVSGSNVGYIEKFYQGWNDSDNKCNDGCWCDFCPGNDDWNNTHRSRPTPFYKISDCSYANAFRCNCNRQHYCYIPGHEDVFYFGTSD